MMATAKNNDSECRHAALAANGKISPIPVRASQRITATAIDDIIILYWSRASPAMEVCKIMPAARHVTARPRRKYHDRKIYFR